MKVVELVFSPTGGTQKAADYIANEWEAPIEQIDLTDAETEYSAVRMEEDDIALIAVPSYGGRVPGLVVQRLAKVRGNRARCVIVCTYGNRAYEDTLLELKDIAEQCGFQVIAAVSAVTEHSIMHQYAAGRPDQGDRDELKDFASRIWEQLCRNDLAATLSALPGNRPYKKAGGAGLVPKANGDCVRCGLCAEKCPAQAIRKEDPTKTDRKKCISCMRCVTQCPKSARRVNGAMVSIAALAIKKACSERKGNELFM